MKIKQGVTLGGLTKEMMLAWLVADSVWDEQMEEGVVTSGLDGKHKLLSKHYTGNALDLRTRYFAPEQIETCARRLREILGRDYDVVVETTHIHVEYDPKGA